MPPPNAYLSADDLDRWARDTNGTPFTDEAKEELKEFLDVNDDGNLTYVFFRSSFCKLTDRCRLNGFMQIYQLQTENDEEETWRDLVPDLLILAIFFQYTDLNPVYQV